MNLSKLKIAIALVAVAAAQAAGWAGEPGAPETERSRKSMAQIQEESVAFDVLKAGQQAFGFEKAAEKVIRTEAEWTEVWKAIESTRVPRPPPDPVDFSKSCLIGVFAGERRTGGYSLAIQAVTRKPDGKTLLVDVRESGPAKGKMVTQAFTSPYVIVRVPRGDFVLEVRRSGP